MSAFGQRGIDFRCTDTLSGLMAHALADLAAAEATGRYHRHKHAAHDPDRSRPGHVFIGLEGAVLAMSFGANARNRLYGFNLSSPEVEPRLSAVGQLEAGRISTAFQYLIMTGEAKVTGDWAAACELHRACHARPLLVFSDAKRWDAYAQWIVNKLQEFGL